MARAEEGLPIVDRRNGKGSAEMKRLVIPAVSVEGALVFISVLVTLFAPWSGALLWFASLGLGGVDPG